jgi:type III restriction enzyme
MQNVLLDIQKEKVDLLYKLLKEKDIVSFQAPTGAGKTMMLAYLINKIKINNPKAIFFVVSLSTGDIAKQNYEKFVQYTKDYGLSFASHHIESVSKNKVQTNKDIEYVIPEGFDVYTMGSGSFDSGTLLYSRGYLQSFICEQRNLDKEIYFIRDEAQIGALSEEKMNKLKQEVSLVDLLDEKIDKEKTKAIKQVINLRQLYPFFKKKLYLSATLSDKILVDCEMSEDEARKEHLIKSKVEYLPVVEE